VISILPASGLELLFDFLRIQSLIGQFPPEFEKLGAAPDSLMEDFGPFPVGLGFSSQSAKAGADFGQKIGAVAFCTILMLSYVMSPGSVVIHDLGCGSFFGPAITFIHAFSPEFACCGG
jgi:hypothetical protein